MLVKELKYISFGFHHLKVNSTMLHVRCNSEHKEAVSSVRAGGYR